MEDQPAASKPRARAAPSGSRGASCTCSTRLKAHSAGVSRITHRDVGGLRAAAAGGGRRLGVRAWREEFAGRGEWSRCEAR